MIMTRVKLVKSEGIKLLDRRAFGGIGHEDFSYKCLGLLDPDDIMHRAMKSRMKGEYTLTVRKIFNSKLNCGNVFKGINSWVVEQWTT